MRKQKLKLSFDSELFEMNLKYSYHLVSVIVFLITSCQAMQFCKCQTQ